MRSDRCSRRPAAERGLTLVELLVAISVMAFVAVLGWRGLDSITRARVSLNEELEQTRGLQLAFAQLQTDCANVVNAAELEGRAPVQMDTTRITLVRRVQAESQPGALQRVTYRLREGVLTREESPPVRDLARLDQVAQAVPSPSMSSVRLQSDVQAMTLRVWADDGRGWRNLNSIDDKAPTSRAALMNPQSGTTSTQLVWSGLEVALRLPGRSASLTKVFMLGSS
jgi:general secretion pathway protein J